MHWLKLIRFPNLIIVALTQYFLQYGILLPALQKGSIPPNLDHFHFALLVLTTILIAAGGYVINDLEDLEIDKINKPKKLIISKTVSVKQAKIYYSVLVFLGLILSLYLANYVGQARLVLIYPTAVFALWFYSKKLKRTVLLGNFIVAIFCAFVAGIVWFAERNAIAELMQVKENEALFLNTVFVAYLFFAFVSTMFREIVKDIEDIQGDQQDNCKTLPVVAGVKSAKIVGELFGLSLFGGMLYLAYSLWQQSAWLLLGYTLLGMLLPTTIAISCLWNADSKRVYSKLSRLAKYIMVSGILFLIVLKFIK